MIVTHLNLTGGRGQGEKGAYVKDSWEMRLIGLSVGCGEKTER